MDGEIGHEELRSLLGNTGDGVRIVDIRPPTAFRRGHLPGSENVPLGELVDDVERFEDDDWIVTVCPKGKSSVKAARLIASYGGFSGRVESFGPGLSNWEGPLETSDDAGGASGPSAAEGSDAEEGDEGSAAPF